MEYCVFEVDEIKEGEFKISSRLTGKIEIQNITRKKILKALLKSRIISSFKMNDIRLTKEGVFVENIWHCLDDDDNIYVKKFPFLFLKRV